VYASQDYCHYYFYQKNHWPEYKKQCNMRKSLSKEATSTSTQVLKKSSIITENDTIAFHMSCPKFGFIGCV
jgi:hypothetical protein